MTDHIYTPRGHVERVSTGERAAFVSDQTGILCVQVSDTTGYPAHCWWPADDCRPVENTRKALCVHCGHSVEYIEGDEVSRSAAIEAMAAHERECPDNPLVEELTTLREILAHIEEGHAVHCAKRMTCGDGECECGMVGSGHDTIAVVSLREDIAAKDARIAELESQLAHISALADDIHVIDDAASFYCPVCRGTRETRHREYCAWAMAQQLRAVAEGE